MTTMLEKVAKAIVAEFRAPLADAEYRMAMAAIEALRVPSDEVREIMGAHARNGFVNWDDYHEAMIDAALNESPLVKWPNVGTKASAFECGNTKEFLARTETGNSTPYRVPIGHAFNPKTGEIK